MLSQCKGSEGKFDESEIPSVKKAAQKMDWSRKETWDTKGMTFIDALKVLEEKVVLRLM